MSRANTITGSVMRELIPFVVGLVLTGCGLFLYDGNGIKAVVFVFALATATAGFELYQIAANKSRS